MPRCALRNIDDVDKTLDTINEQTENMKQIQDALSQPSALAADLDEVWLHSLCMSYRHTCSLLVKFFTLDCVWSDA